MFYNFRKNMEEVEQPLQTEQNQPEAEEMQMQNGLGLALRGLAYFLDEYEMDTKPISSKDTFPHKPEKWSFY